MLFLLKVYWKQLTLSQDDFGLTGFIEQNNLNFETMTSAEFSEFRPQLEETLASVAKDGPRESIEASHFFKVPFQKVLDLVQKRRVFLHKGMAYVNKGDLLSLVLAEFR